VLLGSVPKDLYGPISRYRKLESEFKLYFFMPVLERVNGLHE